MIDRNHKLSLVKQWKILDISRSGVYYDPKPESAENIGLMRVIGEIHRERPFLGVRLIDSEILISMDGRGRALDNVFVERLWRTVKYEDIYLKDYATMIEVRDGLKRYFDFYNHDRGHQSLGYKTPAAIHLK